jgi:hypothetical protein
MATKARTKRTAEEQAAWLSEAVTTAMFLRLLQRRLERAHYLQALDKIGPRSYVMPMGHTVQSCGPDNAMHLLVRMPRKGAHTVHAYATMGAHKVRAIRGFLDRAEFGSQVDGHSHAFVDAIQKMHTGLGGLLSLGRYGLCRQGVRRLARSLAAYDTEQNIKRVEALWSVYQTLKEHGPKPR